MPTSSGPDMSVVPERPDGAARGLAAVRTLAFQRIPDARGTLCVVEGGRDVPFPIERVFYVYGVPESADRGAHAHRSLQQVLVCVAGSMDLVLDDGRSQRTVRVSDPAHGVYIPPMVWAAQTNLQPGTVYMVFASAPYDEADYLRDYHGFLAAVGATGA